MFVWLVIVTNFYFLELRMPNRFKTKSIAEREPTVLMGLGAAGGTGFLVGGIISLYKSNQSAYILFNSLRMCIQILVMLM